MMKLWSAKYAGRGPVGGQMVSGSAKALDREINVDAGRVEKRDGGIDSAPTRDPRPTVLEWDP